MAYGSKSIPYLFFSQCSPLDTFGMVGRFLVVWMAFCLLKSHEMQCIDIAKSLTQLLDNYKDADSLPRDVYFGLNLAYKILSGSRTHLASDIDPNEFYWKTLEYLKVLKSGIHTRNVSVYGEIIMESVSEDSELWQRTIKYRQLDVAMYNDTFLNYEWIVDSGLPNAIDSDKCMAQLGSTKSCVISSKCIEMMTSREPSYGYHKTHQLLFLLLILLKGCSNYLPIDLSIYFIIGERCSEIYRENRILSQWGIPDDYRDLFMEQSLFCGIAGHSEFLAMTTIKSIPFWQSNNGCFNTKTTEVEYLEPKCLNHINSLGVAFYSNLISIHYLSNVGSTHFHN